MMVHCENHAGRPFEPETIEKAVKEGGLLVLELEAGAEGLGLEAWKDLVDQGRALGVRRFILYGTKEPLRSPHTLPLLRHIRSGGDDIELIVRADGASPEVARELDDLTVHVVLSWDGRAEEVPGRKGRPTLSDDAGLSAKGRILDLSRALNGTDPAGIAGLWRSARRQECVPWIPPARKTYEEADSASPFAFFASEKQLFETLARIDSEEFHLPWAVHPPLGGRPCDLLLYSLCVRADGTVTPCAGLDVAVGDAREASLRKIIRESPLVRDLREIRSRLKGYCRTCEWVSECYGCRASAYRGTGDILESDPACFLRRAPAPTAFPFAAKDLIPHSGPMSLISGKAWRESRKVILPIVVPPDNIFVAPDGRVAPPALIEMLAQLCAAEHAYTTGNGLSRGINGFLIGIDHVQFREPVRAGERIDLIVWKILEMKEIHRVQGEILRGTVQAGKAELTLLENTSESPRIESPVRKNAVPPAAPNGGFFPRAAAKDRVSREILGCMRGLAVRSRESFEADFVFPPDFVGFAGHFPGLPLLPGVIIVSLGWLAAELFVETPLEFSFLRKAKFLRPVSPLDEVKLVLRTIRPDAARVAWFSAGVFTSAGLAAKFDIGLTKP